MDTTSSMQAGKTARSEVAAVMPVQFSEIWHRRDLKPEAHLQLAMLEQAVADVRRPRRSREDQRTYLEALGWMLSDNEGWPFSFVNVCLSLGLHPGAVRHAVLRELDAEKDSSEARHAHLAGSPLLPDIARH